MCDIKCRTVYLMRRTDKKDDGTDIYVGSTSRNLRERMWNHRCDAKKLIENYMNGCVRLVFTTGRLSLCYNERAIKGRFWNWKWRSAVN